MPQNWSNLRHNNIVLSLARGFAETVIIKAELPIVNHSSQNFTPEELQNLNQEITVTMPVKYWLAVLQGVDALCQSSTAEIQKLREKGTDYKSLKHSETIAIMGPLFARGVLVKTLVEAGVMTEEADAQMGIDKLMSIAKDFQKQQEGS